MYSLKFNYSKNNSFQYECYLQAENYVYLDGSYVQEYDSKFIHNEIHMIKSALRNQFLKKWNIKLIFEIKIKK